MNDWTDEDWDNKRRELNFVFYLLITTLAVTGVIILLLVWGAYELIKWLWTILL